MEEVLECAVSNDLERLKIVLRRDPTLIDAIGPWIIQSRTSNRVIIDCRTPLTVAAAYGSTKVVSYILSSPNININRRIGTELTTALHCAASSWSPNAEAVVRLLLAAGADRNLVDSNGFKPSDVVNPNFGSDVQTNLNGLLGGGDDAIKTPYLDPSTVPKLPDSRERSSISDDSAMYSFKVRRCKKNYVHDWADCTFFHQWEKARRRDLRKFHYSCEPCPDFEAGSCTKGYLCEYAHGTFETWLHPLRYRTEWCSDGAECSRKICFFAHNDIELRVVSDIPFNPPLMVHNVPTLHLPTGDMRSMLSPRSMGPLNLDDSMNFDNVPCCQSSGSNVAYGGWNFNLNLNLGIRGDHGLSDQSHNMELDSYDDVVGGQIAELGDQFHDMELDSYE